MLKRTFSPVSPHVDFIALEKRNLEYWYTAGIADLYLKKNSASKKKFSFLDGPITANNPMGVHHAWGRTYKDVWQRFHTMLGDKQRYQNGFDCQGLWVEVEVEKELGIKNKKDIENLVPGDKRASIAKFVELCKDRVRKYSAIQTEQTKRLGNFMDWDHSYYTMSDENNYMIWYFLKVCHEKGWIYKGHDSVPWCPRCQTAISQHEMLTEDYKELTHDSIYFTLPVVGRDNEFLLVWTTTPWTIPANIAVAVDGSLTYCLVEGESGKKFWIAKECIGPVFGKEQKKIIVSLKGKELVGLGYRGPFDDLPAVKEIAKSSPKTFHTIIATDPLILPITTEEGTGLVHTAVSAGAEDFRLGKKYNLPVIPVISDNADYLPGLGFLAGKNAKVHPELILDYLKEKGSGGESWVFDIRPCTHRYPVCWRCKTELVWRVTDEWYIGMDQKEICKSTNGKSTNGKTLREQMMETAKMIDWHPAFGLERELDWLGSMHDWLISKKNRYWGLALPIYECPACGHFDVIGGKEELHERAVEGWEKFEGHTPHKPYIDEVKINCSKCKTKVSRVADVGNVWLDAGIVPFSTLVDPETGTLSYTGDKRYWKQWFPFDFVTESFPGQFKNWFYSMIAMATVLEKKNPFRTLLGYATVVGEDGRPMHKSLGNMIEFGAGADTIGVDVMRWIYVTSNPLQNVLFGYKLADEVRRSFHLILWNTYNFFISYALANGFSVSNEKVVVLHILDRWIYAYLQRTIKKATDSLLEYDAQTATLEIGRFVTDFSQWYVRRSRDRVNPTSQNPKDKAECFETMYLVLRTLGKILAPFCPFISDEIYRNLTGEPSVHLTSWPQADKKAIDINLLDDMERVRGLVEKIHAKRKELKIPVRQPLAKCHVSHVPPALAFGKSRWRAGKCQISNELIELVKDETNIKDISFTKGEGEITVELDTTMSPELIEEGKIREAVRKIQQLRKDQGCKLNDRIRIELPKEFQTLPKESIDKIIKNTLAGDVVWGDTYRVIL